MPDLTAMDEYFVHQIPEPLPSVVTHHEHWRESLFFIAHSPGGQGDVVILTMAHFPARGVMDSLQLGRIDGEPTLAHHERPYEGDPHTMTVGPVQIDITEPFRSVHLQVDEAARGAGRARPHLQRPHERARVAARNDEVRARDHLGPVPHGAVRLVRRHARVPTASRARSPNGGDNAITLGASVITPAARCGCGSRCSSPRE